MVVFEDNDEATACDQRIQLLKKELGWSAISEFHFKRNSDRVRRAFISAVVPYSFFYYGLVLNKDPKKLWGDGFKDKISFYKYVCGLVFENARDRLNGATVVIDESGSTEFKFQLAAYLKKRMNISDTKIKKVKMQRSTSNNLLQLADYLAGAINRSVQDKRKFADDYRKMIAHRQIKVQIWPK